MHALSIAPYPFVFYGVIKKHDSFYANQNEEVKSNLKVSPALKRDDCIRMDRGVGKMCGWKVKRIHRAFMRVKLSFRYSNLRVNSLKVKLAEYFRQRFLSFLSYGDFRRRGLSRRNLRRIFTTKVNGESKKRKKIRSFFFSLFFFQCDA